MVTSAPIAALESTLSRLAASAGGAVLAAGTQGVAAVRPARKPLHPEGEIVRGRIYRQGSPERTGVRWIDEPGEDDVLVRRSRAIGLPHTLPDIHGLAVRLHAETDPADLLFATTGWGRLTRFVLTATRQPRSRPLTTLLPYDTDSGALLLAADGTGLGSYDLSWARPSGEWHLFAVLRLSTGHVDQQISFDPVLHQIEGLRQFPSVRRLRSPAYRRARRSRADNTTPTKETHRVH